MDLDDFRAFVLDSGVDVWTWIDMAISVASADHENELKNRRDGIVQRLYAAPAFSRCRNCDHRGSRREADEGNNGSGTCDQEKQELGFDHSSQELLMDEKMAVNEEAEEDDSDDDDGDDQRRQILEIKVLLDDHNQNERCLINLLQRLVDMDTITFITLKETDIGRHVNKLRKHSSGEVRRLVKILVRKWKDTVDEWVKSNAPEEAIQCNADDKTSPHEVEHNQIDESDRFGSAPKRLHGNYQETNHQHAKKQRTAQLMITKDAAMVTNNKGSVPLKYR